MHLVTTKRRKPVSREMADAVRKFAAGGQEVFGAARLPASDQTWWTEATEHVATGILEDCDTREKSDEALIAKIPAEAFQGCYTQTMRDEVIRTRLDLMRRGGGWLLALGFLIRDTDRILMDGIFLGDRVIQARNRLRAFVWAMASEVGFARIVPDDEDEEDSFPSVIASEEETPESLRA